MRLEPSQLFGRLALDSATHRPEPISGHWHSCTIRDRLDEALDVLYQKANWSPHFWAPVGNLYVGESPLQSLHGFDLKSRFLSRTTHSLAPLHQQFFHKLTAPTRPRSVTSISTSFSCWTSYLHQLNQHFLVALALNFSYSTIESTLLRVFSWA